MAKAAAQSLECFGALFCQFIKLKTQYELDVEFFFSNIDGVLCSLDGNIRKDFSNWRQWTKERIHPTFDHKKLIIPEANRDNDQHVSSYFNENSVDYSPSEFRYKHYAVIHGIIARLLNLKLPMAQFSYLQRNGACAYCTAVLLECKMLKYRVIDLISWNLSNEELQHCGSHPYSPGIACIAKAIGSSTIALIIRKILFKRKESILTKTFITLQSMIVTRVGDFSALLHTLQAFHQLNVIDYYIQGYSKWCEDLLQSRRTVTTFLDKADTDYGALDATIDYFLNGAFLETELRATIEEIPKEIFSEKNKKELRRENLIQCSELVPFYEKNLIALAHLSLKLYAKDIYLNNSLINNIEEIYVNGNELNKITDKISKHAVNSHLINGFLSTFLAIVTILVVYFYEFNLVFFSFSLLLFPVFNEILVIVSTCFNPIICGMSTNTNKKKNYILRSKIILSSAVNLQGKDSFPQDNYFVVLFSICTALIDTAYKGSTLFIGFILILAIGLRTRRLWAVKSCDLDPSTLDRAYTYHKNGWDSDALISDLYGIQLCLCRNEQDDEFAQLLSTSVPPEIVILSLLTRKLKYKKPIFQSVHRSPAFSMFSNVLVNGIPGIVKSQNGDQTYNIEYYDGTSETGVLEEKILRKGPSYVRSKEISEYSIHEHVQIEIPETKTYLMGKIINKIQSQEQGIYYIVEYASTRIEKVSHHRIKKLHEEGEIVLCCRERGTPSKNNRYFPSTIIRCIARYPVFDIQYENGEIERSVSAESIRKTKDFVPQNEMFYYPLKGGLREFGNLGGFSSQSTVYDVEFADGEIGYSIPQDFILAYPSVFQNSEIVNVRQKKGFQLARVLKTELTGDEYGYNSYVVKFLHNNEEEIVREAYLYPTAPLSLFRENDSVEASDSDYINYYYPGKVLSIEKYGKKYGKTVYRIQFDARSLGIKSIRESRLRRPQASSVKILTKGCKILKGNIIIDEVQNDPLYNLVMVDVLCTADGKSNRPKVIENIPLDAVSLADEHVDVKDRTDSYWKEACTLGSLVYVHRERVQGRVVRLHNWKLHYMGKNSRKPYWAPWHNTTGIFMPTANSIVHVYDKATHKFRAGKIKAMHQVDLKVTVDRLGQHSAHTLDPIPVELLQNEDSKFEWTINQPVEARFKRGSQFHLGKLIGINKEQKSGTVEFLDGSKETLPVRFLRSIQDDSVLLGSIVEATSIDSSKEVIGRVTLMHPFKISNFPINDAKQQQKQSFCHINSVKPLPTSVYLVGDFVEVVQTTTGTYRKGRIIKVNEKGPFYDISSYDGKIFEQYGVEEHRLLPWKYLPLAKKPLFSPGDNVKYRVGSEYHSGVIDKCTVVDPTYDIERNDGNHFFTEFLRLSFEDVTSSSSRREPKLLNANEKVNVLIDKERKEATIIKVYPYLDVYDVCIPFISAEGNAVGSKVLYAIPRTQIITTSNLGETESSQSILNDKKSYKVGDVVLYQKRKWWIVRRSIGYRYLINQTGRIDKARDDVFSSKCSFRRQQPVLIKDSFESSKVFRNARYLGERDGFRQVWHYNTTTELLSSNAIILPAAIHKSNAIPEDDHQVTGKDYTKRKSSSRIECYLYDLRNIFNFVALNVFSEEISIDKEQNFSKNIGDDIITKFSSCEKFWDGKILRMYSGRYRVTYTIRDANACPETVLQQDFPQEDVTNDDFVACSIPLHSSVLYLGKEGSNFAVDFGIIKGRSKHGWTVQVNEFCYNDVPISRIRPTFLVNDKCCFLWNGTTCKPGVIVSRSNLILAYNVKYEDGTMGYFVENQNLRSSDDSVDFRDNELVLVLDKMNILPGYIRSFRHRDGTYDIETIYNTCLFHVDEKLILRIYCDSQRAFHKSNIDGRYRSCTIMYRHDPIILYTIQFDKKNFQYNVHSDLVHHTHKIPVSHDSDDNNDIWFAEENKEGENTMNATVLHTQQCYSFPIRENCIEIGQWSLPLSPQYFKEDCFSLSYFFFWIWIWLRGWIGIYFYDEATKEEEKVFQVQI